MSFGIFICILCVSHEFLVRENYFLSIFGHRTSLENFKFLLKILYFYVSYILQIFSNLCVTLILFMEFFGGGYSCISFRMFSSANNKSSD